MIYKDDPRGLIVNARKCFPENHISYLVPRNIHLLEGQLRQLKEHS